MKTAKEIRKIIEDRVHPDAVRKAGELVEVKRQYFYHHGQTAESWGLDVQAALTVGGAADIKVIGTRDDFRAWPHDSYMVAIIGQA